MISSVGWLQSICRNHFSALTSFFTLATVTASIAAMTLKTQLIDRSPRYHSIFFAMGIWLGENTGVEPRAMSCQLPGQSIIFQVVTGNSESGKMLSLFSKNYETILEFI